MKNLSLLLIALLFATACQSQKTTVNATSQSIDNSSKPKLIVGIVVDQMRYDYLTRFLF